MAEKEFFVESTDITEECKTSLRNSRLKYVFALVAWLAFTLIVFQLGLFAHLISAIIFTAVVLRFFGTIEKRAKLAAAIEIGEIEERFRLVDMRIVHTKGTPGEDGVQLLEKTFDLASLVTVQASISGVLVTSQHESEFDSIDIPRNRFVTEEAMREFVEMLLPRLNASMNLDIDIEQDSDPFKPA